MKALMAIVWGAVGALVVTGSILVALGPWWLPGAPAGDTPSNAGRVVPGDVTFDRQPPPGYRKIGGWQTMVLTNDAGDSCFLWWGSGELWRVVPPGWDVVPTSGGSWCFGG